MEWRWRLTLTLLLAATVAGKGKKLKQKPGRAILDQLSSTTVVVSDVTFGSEGGLGLSPPKVDVSPYVAVYANASCGDDGEEEYCRNTPGKRGVVCDICEDLDGSQVRRHLADHAVDGDLGTWWQSPTIAAGDQYRDVELLAILPAEMDLRHVIIKCGPSPRPLAWSLEVSSSKEGDDWRMVKAFGDREHCRRLWDLRPERRRRKARAVKRTNRAEKATCSTQFTSMKPIENGQMHVDIGTGISARRIRISFRATHVLPSNQQYYTVRELTIVATCICHGHATHCDITMKGAKCSCLHGTCGPRCQKCCSGSHWSPHVPCETEIEDQRFDVEDRDRGCSCGDRGECSYDETGAILCVNCTENRAGPLCDKCLPGYFNRAPDGPCLPCNCDPNGSDGTCKWDRKNHRISCSCLPNFTGHLCDNCDDPIALLPTCLPITTPACKCDFRGIVDPSGVCDDVCECKAKVFGERCDACAPGYFGLSEDLEEGCRECYCSGVADSCALRDMELPGSVLLVAATADTWLVSDSLGNQTFEPTLDNQGKPYLITYEVEGWENFYWLTSSCEGDLLSAYGGEIKASLFWGVVRGDTGGNPTAGPDAVFIAANGHRLSSRNRSHETPGDMQLSVPIVEGEWYVTRDGQEVLATRRQLLEVLANVKTLMLRAYYHTDQDEVRLDSAEIITGSYGAVEQCACPPGYSGPHCSECAWSHVRLAEQCLPCACNNHASCHSGDGTCGPCLHNTTGPHCERCLPGHYGNPVQGACKPCACPLYPQSNNFSPNCALASSDGDEFVCTQCPDGYSGDHCESCDFGYWGSPTTPGSSCQPCDCGGAPCDTSTGQCITCPAHTEGARCDQCQEGFWFGESGTITESGCVPCDCAMGALSAACDAKTGQCACRDGWEGLKCDSCTEGHGDVSANCPPCRCGMGAANRTCDAVTGTCACAEGTAPPYCDYCLENYYGLADGGCNSCNCSSLGSVSSTCDIRSGQCRCKAHVTGRACDTCSEGWWGLRSDGCRRCDCGAGAAACDPVTGACACAPGVGGRACDSCLQGFYGFGPNGCLPCPVCTDGKICSPETGRCVCPARAHGPGCRQCAAGYWWRRGRGCVSCDCRAGAVSNSCDPQSGSCRCRAGWAGPKCDVCAVGHFGPKCRPCHCNVEGTETCSDGLCGCDDTGQCVCKTNVIGEKCDRCRNGTFGLSLDNPTGCTECFCFGRSAHCTQAGLTRAAIYAATHNHLTLINGESPGPIDTDSLLAIHTKSTEETITLPYPPVPVYIELDKRFAGDRITSYGGSLRFRVEEEGGRDLPMETRTQFPLVRLYSKRDIVLDYFERVPPINNTYSVRLHESLWTVRGLRTHRVEALVSTRAVLMVALEAVDRILVRVSTREPTFDNNVHVLLLNVSLDTAIPGESRSERALGVELCDCPRGYQAGSCQQPAIGFWMPPPRVHLTNQGSTIVINVEGEAQPCFCNGRSTTCHPQTGDCLNCTRGTSGPRCDRCAEGHYGAPDAPGGCQPCPCPERTRNFAAACVFNNGALQCLCKHGYSGVNCEACDSGWRRGPNGSCVPCGCDPVGSLSSHCDPLGRCRCRPFATGTQCDLCKAHRSFMDYDGCQACDNCTQSLLNSAEALTSDLRRRVNLNELSRIPKPFPALLEFAHNSSQKVEEFNKLKNDLQHTGNGEKSVLDLDAYAEEVKRKTYLLKKESARREKEAEFLNLESMSGLEEALKQRRRLSEQVEVLNEFARSERHLSAHRALKEARHLLRNIKEIRLLDYISGANDVFDSANLQSTAVQEYNYRIEDVYRRLRKLQSEFNEWERKTDDFPKLIDRVWAAGDAIAALEKSVKPRMAEVRDTVLRCRLMLEDVNLSNSQNLTDAINEALARTKALSNDFPALTAEIQILTLGAEEKEGILYNLTPAYTQKYLNKVEKHAAELGEKARWYKSLFAGTRALASAGVNAARAWTDVADTVRKAGRSADAAMETVGNATKLAGGPQELLNKAEQARRNSEELSRKGSAVLERAERLRNELEQTRRGADVARVALRGLGWQERELGARPVAHVEDTIAKSSETADRVFATTRALYDEASEVRSKVRYNLRRQLAELQRHGDTALGAAQEHVSQIRGNTERAQEASEALAAAAAARAREHAAASSTLSPALQALKDQVARARHAADSISVSLTSPLGGAVGCARAFSPPASSPAITKVAVALSFDGTVRDGPLLYLVDDTQDSEKYMKLLVHDNKLLLTWNLGSGIGTVAHPETIRPTHDDGDHTAYRIEIERVWNSVRLTVERAGAAALTASNSSDSDAISLHATSLWLGSPRDSRGLPACVHALYCDDRRVGLWNFVQQPSEAKCTGCTQRWYNPRSGELNLAWFNGNGYAELRRTGYRPTDRRQFSISFTLRSRDENALLFMARDAANNRSVSVVLRDCRVVFLVEYQSSKLEITASGRHCHGRPVHVQAIRVFASNKLEKGSLRVNGEETLGSPSPPVQSPSALPDLTSARYWVGGLPPGAGISTPALLGCVGGLTVDREGYDLLNTPTRHGVEPSCGTRSLRSAIIEGAGYIELPSPSFRRKAALGLSFRARSPNGLLLYRAPATLDDNEVDEDDDTDDGYYLALVLVEGELQVIAAAGKTELRLQTNGSRFDDGRLHSVRIVRAHKQLELLVDGERMASGALAGNAFPARSRGLYLGGVPTVPHSNTQNFLVTGFTGTVADYIVDASLIGLESAVSWRGALLGRADSEPSIEARNEPTTMQAHPEKTAECTKRSSYTVEAGAVKFGDSVGSYATLKLPAKGKELTIALHLRTFSPDGLLLLIPGSKNKPKHYIALVVREGKMKLVVRGRKRKELNVSTGVATGTWHMVQIRVSRRVSLTVDNSGTGAHSPPAARSQRLYVGGIPPPPTLPNIPNSIIRLGGFRGCVRRVVVNGRAEDLVRDAAQHHRVGQCFPNIQQGAYFGGDAYAIWSSSWTPSGPSEVSSELRLQFRTAEPNGVLLSANGLVLEVKDAAVMITYHWSADAPPSRAEARAADSGALCDERWHVLTVRVSRTHVSLAVDASPPVRGGDDTVLTDTADEPRRGPLYIGGLPEGSLDSADSTRENFKGCIRDVTVGGQKRDWVNMESLHNVLLDSCPIA